MVVTLRTVEGLTFQYDLEPNAHLHSSIDGCVTWKGRDRQHRLHQSHHYDSVALTFHGNETVQRYVLTLLNVVSAIYSDPTLGSNLKFVLSRIISVPETDNPIVSGKSKKSLANVNKWNEAFLRDLPEDQKHDLAIWLTRKDIGGPSGYAPVSGICDPARSCSLIHEDGLSSTFIIAHELGHLLGLSHDGDASAGNECRDEALQGSVMAPLVGATFSYFHWSSCSAEEYHFMSDEWHCLKNPPRSPQNVTFISNSFLHAYTLDEQCRMEFGDGFQFCKSFQLPDPCAQLWCSHDTTPDTCKTKKGPPMDGTECDVGKWCINGYCESTSKRRRNEDGLRHNPQAGGWSQWGSWEDCSRTCGTGVAFRARKCDNPRPTYGGEQCRGDAEEFRLCNLNPCPKAGDFRAQQCSDLFELISMNPGQQSSRSKMTWYPYEHELEDYKCKLTCHNRESREYYQTGENVIDGTSCSYDHPSDVCIQGKCVKLGCDMTEMRRYNLVGQILGSPLVEDRCGTCGGNGDQCEVKYKELRGPFKSARTKIAYLPRGTRNIRILVRSKGTFLAFKEQKENNWITFDQNHGPQTNNNSSMVSAQTKANPPFRQTFVSSGAKFEVSPGAETFSARGPLISPLTIFAGSMEPEVSQEFENYMVDLQYNESPQKESTKSRPELVVKGWSKCSKECGGGRQTVVLSSSAWEECTHTCGVQGVQIRQSFCVPVEMNHSWGTPLWSGMVDPTNCRGDKPQRSRECNRVPCIGDWVQSDWTSCSTSCGIGIQKATFECQSKRPHDLFYDCGPRPVVHKHCQLASTCPKEPCQSRLEVDQSEICADQVMQRYCAIPSYRKMCCQSCRKHTEWQYL
ncbi:hypothetical protein TCAL_00704 [Tigriopus californicus]|uniref:Peptidase M12B domain-containing protein n=1 Tax=Tigriopus californicus TaxID=6832 RepID=A0A553PCM2_TIGCA|nr:hypothetical protein TCAL_00704 [Tigriopus californicus]